MFLPNCPIIVSLTKMLQLLGIQYIYYYSDVPPDVLTFTITVMNRGRRAKDTEVAEVTVDMQALKSGSETEEWYPLTGVTPIGRIPLISIQYKN